MWMRPCAENLVQRMAPGVHVGHPDVMQLWVGYATDSVGLGAALACIKAE